MNIIENWTFIHNGIGLLHFVSALLSLVFGSIVLLSKKGTNFHRIMGLNYCLNMLILNFSSFGIYNFGKLSVFHVFALISLFTLFKGMIPMLKRNNKNKLKTHFYYMSWSVVGLYAAFWAETGVRFFDIAQFWWVVFIATTLTTLCRAYIINKQQNKYFPKDF